MAFLRKALSSLLEPLQTLRTIASIVKLSNNVKPQGQIKTEGPEEFNSYEHFWLDLTCSIQARILILSREVGYLF